MIENTIETKIEKILTSEHKGQKIWHTAISFIFLDKDKKVSIYKSLIATADSFEISIRDVKSNFESNSKTFKGMPNNQSMSKGRELKSMLNSSGVADKNAPELLEYFTGEMLKHMDEITASGSVEKGPEPTDFFTRVKNPSWNNITANMKKYLHIEDETPYIAGQACSLASKIPTGENVWMGIVGPSGMGKTVFSRFLIPGDVDSNAWFVERSDFTSKTLVSGKEDTADMIDDLDKKMLIFGDYTLLLGKSAEELNAILGQLRLIHDGRYIKSFGSGVGTKAHFMKFGLLFGVTNKIDTVQNEIAVLGPRNIHVRFPESTPEFSEKLVHAAFMGDDNSAFEKAVSDEMLSMYENFDPKKLPTIPEHFNTYIEHCALITANLRIPVERDQFLPGRPTKLYPLKEEAGRLVKIFKKMGQCITHVLGKKELDHEVLSCVYRLAIDTPDFMRVAVFRAITFEEVKIDEISEEVHLEPVIVKMILQDLERAHLITIKDEMKAIMNEEKAVIGFKKTGEQLYKLDKSSHVLRYIMLLEMELGHLRGKERHHNLMNFDPIEFYKKMHSHIPDMTQEEQDKQVGDFLTEYHGPTPEEAEKMREHEKVQEMVDREADVDIDEDPDWHEEPEHEPTDEQKASLEVPEDPNAEDDEPEHNDPNIEGDE